MQIICFKDPQYSYSPLDIDIHGDKIKICTLMLIISYHFTFHARCQGYIPGQAKEKIILNCCVEIMYVYPSSLQIV